MTSIRLRMSDPIHLRMSEPRLRMSEPRLRMSERRLTGAAGGI
jgi:hypothetical protein